MNNLLVKNSYARLTGPARRHLSAFLTVVESKFNPLDPSNPNQLKTRFMLGADTGHPEAEGVFPIGLLHHVIGWLEGDNDLERASGGVSHGDHVVFPYTIDWQRDPDPAPSAPRAHSTLRAHQLPVYESLDGLGIDTVHGWFPLTIGAKDVATNTGKSHICGHAADKYLRGGVLAILSSVRPFEESLKAYREILGYDDKVEPYLTKSGEMMWRPVTTGFATVGEYAGDVTQFGRVTVAMLPTLRRRCESQTDHPTLEGMTRKARELRDAGWRVTIDDDAGRMYTRRGGAWVSARGKCYSTRGAAREGKNGGTWWTTNVWRVHGINTRLLKEINDAHQTLIYDECDTALSQGVMLFLMRLTQVVRIGMSGTISVKRGDAAAVTMTSLFGPTIHTVTKLENYERGNSQRPIVYMWTVGNDLKAAREARARERERRLELGEAVEPAEDEVDDYQEQLEALASSPECLAVVLHEIEQSQRVTGAAGAFLMIGVHFIAHGEYLLKQLTAAGVPALLVNGSTPKARRDEAEAAFIAGDVVLIAGSGWARAANIKEMRVLILAMGFKSESLYNQWIGRIERQDGIHATARVVYFRYMFGKVTRKWSRVVERIFEGYGIEVVPCGRLSEASRVGD